MSRLTPAEWDAVYQQFEAPIAAFDCGQHCAPFNDGEPVCCHTRHVIPVMWVEEWDLLRGRTALWHEFRPMDAFERRLVDDTPPEQRLMECSGAQFCERENRSLACRAFPFFPYVTQSGDFIGLAYYWEYADRCWVISNLAVVTEYYRAQFVATYVRLFDQMPDERETFRRFSSTMRRSYAQRGQSIPLLHRDGGAFWVRPGDGQLTACAPDEFPRFRPFDGAGSPS